MVVTPGSPTAAIVYDITVTNDGELPLEKVPVADANVNAAACNQTHSGVLPVAGTWTYQCTSTVAIVANPPTGGQVETNTAVATAKADSNTLIAQSTAVVTLLVPKIALTKTADTPTVAAGAPISSTLVVSNTGNVDLTNVLVSDPSVFSCNTVIAVLARRRADCPGDSLHPGHSRRRFREPCHRYRSRWAGRGFCYRYGPRTGREPGAQHRQSRERRPWR